MYFSASTSHQSASRGLLFRFPFPFAVDMGPPPAKLRPETRKSSTDNGSTALDELWIPQRRAGMREQLSGLLDGIHPKGQSGEDRKSTRLNSSHLGISYAVFCLK